MSMKNYKKGLLTLMVLSAMSLMAAEDPTIYVNTFDDEDGENSSKCSLREAVTAASTHQAYGGCSKGQIYQTKINVIQLEAGTYNLNKELTPNSDMEIVGKAPSNFAKADALTNNYPALTPIQTVISGLNKSRIINTTNLNRPDVSLTNLVLKDAFSSSVGGALLLGGKTDLSNVSIQNAKATSGGAIYLNDVDNALTVAGGEFRNNQAKTGSVLAMSCMDNLNYTGRTISLSGSTYIQNGSANSQSMLTFCGLPAATLTANTLTENVANSTTGNIIEFSTKKGTTVTNLSESSALTMLSNTIIKNTAQSALLYNEFGTKALSFNVIGFNSNKSCLYNDGDVSQIKTANMTLRSNALNLTSGDICQLPVTTLADSSANNVLLDGQSFDSLFTPLQDASENTAFLPMYFLKDNATKTDLVDVGTLGCAELEQRGFKRVNNDTLDSAGNAVNSCDIGSTENLKLTLKNFTQVNVSVLDTISGFEKLYNLYKDTLNNTAINPEFLTYYKLQQSYYADLVNNTKSDQKYRTIFVDPLTTNTPEELVLSNGARQIKHLTVDNYTVTAVPVGVGKLDSSNNFLGSVDNNLKCSWNANLKSVLVYRLDDRLTPSGDSEICKYTLTEKGVTPAKSVSAYILGSFANIAPNVPEETTVKVEHGTNQKVNVDLLNGVNDDGDGLVSALTSNPNKSPYYLNSQGQTQAIRIIKIPDGVTMQAERTGACPGEDKKYSCYGGNMTFQLNNSLDVFNYTIEYAVYDADGTISTTSKLYLKNSALATGSTRTSGGGSFGWISVLGFMGVAVYRYRKQKKA